MTILDIEVFVKEVYKSLRVQVEVKEKLIMEPKLGQMLIEKEESSRQMQTNDVANTKAQVWYNGTIGEGVEQASRLESGKFHFKSGQAFQNTRYVQNIE